ncbi:MAG: hypothetical protein ACRC62_34850 [Microcoleus sp.]
MLAETSVPHPDFFTEASTTDTPCSLLKAIDRLEYRQRSSVSVEFSLCFDLA